MCCCAPISEPRVAARIAEAVGKGRYDKSVSADDVTTIVATEVEKVSAPWRSRW